MWERLHKELKDDLETYVPGGLIADTIQRAIYRMKLIEDEQIELIKNE